MKKILGVAVAAVLLAGLWACASEEPPEIPPETTTAQTTTTQYTTLDRLATWLEERGTITERVHESMTEFTFAMQGASIYDEFLLYVEAIEITGEGFYQRLEGIGRVHHMTGSLFLTDYNNDGFLDLRLFLFPGGTGMQSPSIYWFWDNDVQQFVLHEQLTELSSDHGIRLEEDGRVSAFSRGGGRMYSASYFSYINGQFVEENRRVVDGWTITYYERINGEMVLVRTEVEEIQ